MDRPADAVAHPQAIHYPDTNEDPHRIPIPHPGADSVTHAYRPISVTGANCNHTK